MIFFFIEIYTSSECSIKTFSIVVGAVRIGRYVAEIQLFKTESEGAKQLIY